MKAYVVKLLVIDLEDDIGEDGVQELFDHSEFCTNLYDVETLEIGEWSDEHELNQFAITEEILNKYRG